MAKRTYKKWTEEEKQSFFNLIKEHPITVAIELHANNTNRNIHSTRNWYYRNLQSGKLPQEVLDSASTRNTWTNTEIADLCQLVSEYPHNLTEAFRICSRNTGRTPQAIQTFFTRYRRKEEAKVCMATVGGKKSVSPNRKNIFQGTGGTIGPTKQSKWKRIIKILFG